MVRNTCKGKCDGQIGVVKHTMLNIKRYNDGQKFCPRCNIWLKILNSRCICCNEILRTKSRCKKGEDRWKNAY